MAGLAPEFVVEEFTMVESPALVFLKVEVDN